ncbi:MAG TPA: hypothetical protein VFU47_00330 [Armatimonadota bacterium]|nr:hypothetical protein [Armatimonadota bacterium]
MATADDLSAMYSVPVGTIYRWASLDRWRRTRYVRPIRYDMADADTSYQKYREPELDT